MFDNCHRDMPSGRSSISPAVFRRSENSWNVETSVNTHMSSGYVVAVRVRMSILLTYFPYSEFASGWTDCAGGVSSARVTPPLVHNTRPKPRTQHATVFMSIATSCLIHVVVLRRQFASTLVAPASRSSREQHDGREHICACKHIWRVGARGLFRVFREAKGDIVRGWRVKSFFSCKITCGVTLLS